MLALFESSSAWKVISVTSFLYHWELSLDRNLVFKHLPDRNSFMMGSSTCSGFVLFVTVVPEAGEPTPVMLLDSLSCSVCLLVLPCLSLCVCLLGLFSLSLCVSLHFFLLHLISRADFLRTGSGYMSFVPHWTHFKFPNVKNKNEKKLSSCWLS